MSFRVNHSARHVGVLLIILLALRATEAGGQSTAFTYQGELTATGELANGSYDLRFALFGVAAGGAQLGAAQTVAAVPVSDGVFTVALDFGATAFPGANRFLEIGIRPAGVGGFTTLAPRQQITATPYAIHALNAQQLDGVAAGQYVRAADNGSVGIGTTTPTSKLDVVGQDGLRITGFQPFVTLRDTNSGGKTGFVQSADGDTLLVTNSRASLVLKDSTGRVGIGTATPETQLQIAGGAPWTSNGWLASLGLGNATALGWAPNGSGQRFGIGQSTGGLYFFRTNSAFGSIANPSNYDMIIADNGNVGIGTVTPMFGKLHVNGGNAYGGVHATTGSTNVPGVYGGSTGFNGSGVIGEANTGTFAYGVWGKSATGIGVRGTSSTWAVYADGPLKGTSSADIDGSVDVGGNLNVAFLGQFGSNVVAHNFIETSDANAKANFSDVEPLEVLQRLADLPIQTWNFRNEKPSVRHLGPVAQDFRAAFDLGYDDKHISTVDASGVAFAAIQGLYQVVQEKDRQLRELHARVDQLERLVLENTSRR